MSKFASKYRYIYDAAPQAALAPNDGVAITATGNLATHVLDKVQGWWNNPQFPADNVFAVAINVEAADFTTGDETYTVELEFGDAGYAHSVKPHKATIKGVGQYVFNVDIPTIVQSLGAYALNEFRVVLTLAGTTPSITLKAFMAGEIIDGL
jgi:hypothetical protein